MLLSQKQGDREMIEEEGDICKGDQMFWSGNNFSNHFIILSLRA